MEKLPKISESELEVMRVIWEYNAPMTITQLRTELESRLGWEASTAKTLVSRLCKKGALVRSKSSEQDVYCYSALVSRDEYGRESADKLIDKIFGGNAGNLIAALLKDNKLTQEDITELQELWGSQTEE